MKRIACILLVLSLASSALAEDWLGMIKQLRKQPRSRQVNEKIATCYNNLGMNYYRKKDWSNAEKNVLRAYDMDRTEPVFKRNLALINLEQASELFSKRASRSKGGSMHARAKLLAQRALKYDHSLTAAHVLIGRIEYDNQRIKDAKKSLEKAHKQDPSFPGLAGFLDKVSREEAVEKKFAKTRNSFFELRYNVKNIDKKTAQGLRLAMDVARQHVGRDFAFRPKHKIVVLIYSPKMYAGLRLGPHWSAGLYDGKIRLPLEGEESLDEAVATLFHEYTHALLDDLAGRNCPRWLNEGLAEVQEQKISKKEYYVLPQAAKTGKLFRLDMLNAAFQSDNTGVVLLGYEQARSVAQFMADKYGYRRLKKVLVHLSDGKPIEVALREGLNVRMNQLEFAWRESLLKQLAKKDATAKVDSKTTRS